MDNTLDYLDQVLFLSQDALGHGPVAQLTWIYDGPADIDALRVFQDRLGRGALGRRVERSPLPFGRHRWLAWSGPGDLEVAVAAIPRHEVGAWADRQGTVPIDPERTPWRLAVQPLSEGGTALTLVVSHTVTDGIGALRAVADAVNDVTTDFGFPVSDRRTRAQIVRADARDFLRSIPAMARAAARIPRSLREVPDWGQPSPGPRIRSSASAQPVLHSVTAHLGLATWDERAGSLGGSSNSLFLGFVARLVAALGWAGADGKVNLTLPVSERADEGDPRANALNGVSLRVDPETVTSGLAEIRAGLKAALTELGDNPNIFSGPIALTPLVPKFVARQVEVKAQQNRIVSCSNLGAVDPAVNRPDGSEAGWFALRTFWNRLACKGKPIERAGGLLFPVVSGRVRDSLFITVCYASVDADFTGEKLRDLVVGALSDFGLAADIE